MSIELARELIDFIDESPSAFHATDKVKRTLLKDGYIELKEKEKWELKEYGKYFLSKNNSAIIAFQVGNEKVEEK